MSSGRGWKFARVVSLWLVVLVALLATVRSSIASLHRANGSSDAPTIRSGDLVLVNRVAYGLRLPFAPKAIAEWASPQRGDIVLFAVPDRGYLATKRVVAIPGDVIELSNSDFILNGARAVYSRSPDGDGEVEWESVQDSSRPVIRTEQRSSTMPALQLPAGHFFLLGDDRAQSLDSREFGPVPRQSIVGRVVVSESRSKRFAR
jgi:signal peptidase I